MARVCARESLQWGRCRKAAEGRLPRSRAALQRCFNGAAAERQRKAVPLGHPRVERLEASMGPLPKGSGRVPGLAAYTGIAAASMGPLPKGSGRLLFGKALARVRLASMGPLPKGSGRRIKVDALAREDQASMGPLPKGSGRRRTPRSPSCCRRSFNGAAAERQRKASTQKAGAPSRGLRFNGAAAERQRKARDPRDPVHRRGDASMGPLPKGSGRRRRRTTPALARASFNGAAAERQRKEARTRRQNNRRGPASMGPLPKGSGRPPRC